MVTLRAVTADEYRDFAVANYAGFGETPRDEALERDRTITELDRTLAGFDDRGRIVATSAVLSDRISVPGGSLACAGVTAVTVRTDHRRQGLLRRMMDGMLDQAHERGEPLAALYASEAPIYGRFGFGPAAPAMGLTVRSGVASLVHEPRSRAEIVQADEAMAAMPRIYDAATRQRTGMVHRDPARWNWYFGHDDPADRAGASARYHAIVEGRGYAIYRLKPLVGSHTGEVAVAELIATDPDAYAALWKLALSIDLFSDVVAHNRPPDDPLRHLLADADVLTERNQSPLYLRLVDLAAALASRTYADEGALVLEVDDPFRPPNKGRWRLEAGLDGASCTRTSAQPDLVLDATTLSALYLGGWRWRTLADASKVAEHRPGAVAEADALFRTDRAPWNAQYF